jgi:hypothetical protein
LLREEGLQQSCSSLAKLTLFLCSNPGPACIAHKEAARCAVAGEMLELPLHIVLECLIACLPVVLLGVSLAKKEAVLPLLDSLALPERLEACQTDIESGISR